MTAQHTPGQWKNDGMKLGRSPEHRFWEIVGGDPERLIAQVRTFNDAHLITAAPELLEALEALLGEAETLEGILAQEFGEGAEPPEFARARAAIAAARGER